MRAVLVSSLFLLFACGGSNKPAESAGDTPSSETSTSSGDTDAMAEDGAAAPAASAAEAPAADAPAASPPAAAGPTVTGAIDGKPFAPKVARITHPMQKDGRVFVVLDEHAECGADYGAGDGLLSMLVTWEDGYKVDLGSLKHAGKKGGGEISFARAGAHGKRDVSTTFKPTGRVTIVKAPMEQGSVGKLNIDLQSGDYMLSGDLDVQTCVSPKAAQAAGKKKKKK